MAMKLLGADSQVHISRVKPAPVNSDPPPDQQKNSDSTYACKPLELKLLFQKKKPSTEVI